MIFNFTEPLNIFLIQIVSVVSLTRVLSIFLHKIGQPRVIAEVLGGIIMGPSVLGRLIPGYMDTIFPVSGLPGLSLIANLGLVLYLYLVGIEMNLDATFKNFKKTAMIAFVGISFPMMGGYLVSPYLYDQFMKSSGVDLTTFIFFICVAISITAFPVLCRILNETNILKTIVGTTTLGAAAIDDVVAWCLLALSISMINTGDPVDAFYIFLIVVCYAIFMLTLIRKLWHKIVSFYSRITLIPLTFILIFLSSWVTSTIGVHGIFGAFLFGLIMPRNNEFTLEISDKIEELVQIVFLPLYFALSGLNTNIGSITTSDGISFFIILTTAILSKFVGCTLGALCSGLSLRCSSAVGVLMNTRGLVELIVLNVGLHAHIISDKLFTLMVFMALITTMMTTPLLDLIYPLKHRIYIMENEGIPLHFIITMYDDISDIIAMISLFNHPKKIRISTMIETSSSTTDIVRATSNIAVMPPHIEIIRTICSLMNIEIDHNNVCGNPRSFGSEIVHQSNISDMDLTVLSYKTNDHAIIKNIINLSPNKVLLTVSGMNKPRIIVGNTFIEILVIITDDELFEIIKKFEDYSHIRLYALLLVKSNNAMKEIKWYKILNTEINKFEDIINIINHHSFDFILMNYSQLYIGPEEDVFRSNNPRDIKFLGTIGTFLYINHNKSSLIVLHSNNIPYPETIRKDEDNQSIAHVDTLFINVNDTPI